MFLFCVLLHYFYPRPPRGGRRQDLILSVCLIINISIHALREEGDRLRLALTSLNSSISIHALREEGDREVFIDKFGTV